MTTEAERRARAVLSRGESLGGAVDDLIGEMIRGHALTFAREESIEELTRVNRLFLLLYGTAVVLHFSVQTSGWTDDETSAVITAATGQIITVAGYHSLGIPPDSRQLRDQLTGVYDHVRLSLTRLAEIWAAGDDEEAAMATVVLFLLYLERINPASSRLFLVHTETRAELIRRLGMLTLDAERLAVP